MGKARKSIYVEEALLDYFEADDDEDYSLNQKLESVLSWAIDTIENDPELSARLVMHRQLQSERDFLNQEIESMEADLHEEAS